MHLHLVDRDPALARAWRDAFADRDDVTIHEADYFSQPADAIVSPANSFGIMDGGLDLAIRNELGFAIQHRVQRAIVEQHHGELPVGCAVVVETGDSRWPRLIAAATMRIPEPVGATLNAYLAMRAVIVAGRELSSLVCCGLATGIGAMEPRRAAVQMRVAYLQAIAPARIPSFAQIHDVHQALRRA